MSIQTELTRLTNAKAAIQAAIEGKGVTVPDGTLLDGMAALIEAIEAGGGGVIYGTFTLTEATKNITIEHNLGSLPNFAMFVMKNGTAKNNNTIFGGGGISNVSYFAFSRTNSDNISIKASTTALTKELSTSSSCLIGSLNAHTMDVGVPNDNQIKWLESGKEYLWLVMP